MPHVQTDAELLDHLREQVEFLRASAGGYDGGNDAEAKRLAGAVRTLCHHTAGSHSLLGQLGQLDVLRFVDTAPPEPVSDEEDEQPGLLGHHHVHESFGPYGGRVPRIRSATRPGAPRTPPRFSGWWAEPVMLDSAGHSFTRKDVVLLLSNKDGGVHVDPTLPESYAAVARHDSLGVMSFMGEDGETHEVSVNPLLATMRQIAYEVEATLQPLVHDTATPEDGGAP